MIRLHFICGVFLAAIVTPLWSQTDTTRETETVQNPEDRMQTPPPVTGQNYPTAFTSEERANYLRYGVVFTPAYTDNALGGGSAHPVSDVSYSLAPMVAIDEITHRAHLVGTYAPGFTFYQRLSSRNEADHNASLDFSYRLSPHVTFNTQDTFQKSSNVFNQPNLGSGGSVSGGTQVPNFSVIAPVASRLSNTGSVGLSYQFALNGMIGANGTFTNLHYPEPSQVPGLFDSASQGGSAFYSLRFSKMNYLGATYQYQRLVAYLTAGLSETQTHAIMLFYTLYPSSHFTLSMFGGPQHSNTVQPATPPLNLPIPAAKAWNPAAGASLNWQGRESSITLSYSHVISGGGGLVGAVHMDSATAIVRQQLLRTLSGSITGAYTNNKVITTGLPGTTNGHSISGTVSLQQQLGEHFDVQLGYTRLHQSYSNLAIVSLVPDTNREFMSISYQFSRPLGR